MKRTKSTCRQVGIRTLEASYAEVLRLRELVQSFEDPRPARAESKSVVSKVARMTRRRVESDCNDYNRVA